MKSSVSCLALALASAVCLVCVTPAHAELPRTPLPGELARVGDADSAVIWLAGQNGDVGMAVVAKFPHRPLVAPRFFLKHSAEEVFLAVAPDAQPLPAALRSRESLTRTSSQREQLRRDNAAELATLPESFAEQSSSLAGSCTAQQKTWAASIYGDPTCGQPPAGNPVFTATVSDYYCEGCENPLGSDEPNACTPDLLPCDRVRRNSTSVRLRTTSWNGPVTFQHSGHSMHFAVHNCSGNGPVTFNFSRTGWSGSGSVQLDPLEMWNIRAGDFSAANAAKKVTMGQWTVGRPESGSTYDFNAMSVDANSGATDAITACGDIITKYSMEDLTIPACHGNADVALCNGTNCNNACFHCYGPNGCPN
ncbi:hypothetical protein [Myxococcus llanfairpwllgwyngyllgogerychwyrndrobwllllantysiliogogogochensis]|uniref:hypothetical protein n=1 Tax=Myxococcus llanfairpwllgwyngyllgogerychwyrndrobwllllantysiliogogogochensis TaxID=2590453 RepID=UPI001FE49980|nr:hypothetical protein [Myxococcus llanfairpwllgwyngyllgogerychwyrndrobwllllantysiliogogogochensis]